ncbi:hypothetical protein PMI09_00832 [Rhizobium sp. CF122]|nr:hypothetical protein PMI09_00832 [Rhizobium sp. CF122]
MASTLGSELVGESLVIFLVPTALIPRGEFTWTHTSQL